MMCVSPRYNTIINSTDLKANLGNSQWKVIDCRFSLMDPSAGISQYQDSHIPGALYADLDKDLAAPTTHHSGRHPLPNVDKFIQLVESWGIDSNTQIVVYDDAKGAIAARLWWMMKWLGHENVAVLDGGLSHWINLGYPIDKSQVAIEKKKYQAKVQTTTVISTDDVISNLTAQSFTLLDARSADRYNGITEPIDKIAGHIPSALNFPFEENLSPDGTFLPIDQLRNRYLEIVDRIGSDRVVHMCGSGVTACHNLLAMEIAGFTGSCLYVGSWSEWIQNDDRPIVTG